MPSNEMNIERYILILRTHARLILVIFSAAILIAATITYQTPKMYTATASLNFDFSGANPADGSKRDVYARDAYIVTQKGIIESQRVAQEVELSLTDYERERLIEALNAKSTTFDKLRRNIKNFFSSVFNNDKESSGGETLDGETQGLQVRSAYGWLTRSIGDDLLVEPVFNSRIVKLSYSSTDRQIATLMANRYSEAYVAANLQMMIDPARKTEVWFNEQLKTLRARLEDAQSRLTNFQRQEGIVAKDERLDTETSRLQSLSSQLVATQQIKRNAVTEQQKLNEVLNSGASLMTFEPVFENSVVQRINTDIRGIKGQLAEASSQLGENHPRMKQLRSERAAAQKRLDAEVLVIIDGINNATELAAERESELAKELEAQKQLVLDLKYQHDRITVLVREVESAQITYNAALAQMNTSSMKSRVDQTNVSVVDPANVPGTHSSPSWTKNLLLGALAGLLLGIGISVFMEMFVRRVYSKDDLMLELGVPLLGHLKKA